MKDDNRMEKERDAAHPAEGGFSPEAAVEALLFATGRAVGTDELALSCGIRADEMRRIVRNLAGKWNREERGTCIIELDDSWQMCTRKEYYPQLIALELHPRKPKLTEVLLETLAVIAYRQPVTKAEIERIRGVNSDHAVNRLVEFRLVTELGRAKLPGRPILFGTTREFLRIFGMNSREALPDISPLEMEDFREEAEKEAGEETPAPTSSGTPQGDAEIKIDI